jgi:serine/threonine-protein kinase
MNDRSLEAQALEVFAAALDQSAEDREAFLTQACLNNTKLRNRVADMLRVDANPELLATKGFRVGLPHADSSHPDQVGPYRIIGRLGEGGMGVVYQAERADGAFERKVAVKFVNSGWMSDELLARFANERHITARLEHPNIARLIDGGDIDGRPYIVMEYVEGQPLKFDANVATEVQINRFCAVCDALDYAHNNLVLHRDIKPNNVLVTPEGVPKLLDFGIAKLIAEFQDQDQQLTHAGTTPMTPAYTSPECLAGAPATVRSEVYSLGVLLYELLQGHLPYDLTGLSVVEVHQRVSAGEIIPIDAVEEDLELIVATAMHVDPERRYASASALAGDLRSFGRRQPIMARRDDLKYVSKRFVQRNKSLVSIALVGLFTLVLALAATTNAYLETEKARAEAQTQAATATNVVDFLAEMLTGANPHSGVPMGGTIDEALAYAERRLEARFADQPASHVYLLSRLAGVYSGRNQLDKAMDYVNQAQKLAADNDLDQERASSTYYMWAEVAFQTLQLDQALQWSNKAVELARQSNGPLGAYLGTLSLQGRILLRMGRSDEALLSLREVIAQADGTDQLTNWSLAAANYGIGEIYASQSRYEDALDAFDRSSEILKSQGELSSPNAFQVQLQKAASLARLDRWDEAEALYIESIARMEAALGVNHPLVYRGVSALGLGYRENNRPQEAAVLLEQHLALTENYPQQNEAVAALRANLYDIQCTVLEGQGCKKL